MSPRCIGTGNKMNHAWFKTGDDVRHTFFTCVTCNKNKMERRVDTVTLIGERL